MADLLIAFWTAKEKPMVNIPVRTKSHISTEHVSRRSFLERSIAGAALTCGGLAGCATKVPGNTPKMEAQYQDRANGLAHCGICKHFISPNACEVVAGPVQADGWCRFYTLL